MLRKKHFKEITRKLNYYTHSCENEKTARKQQSDILLIVLDMFNVRTQWARRSI